MLVNGKKRSPISADVFGSACYTFQKGRFSKLYGDLTRVDARMDLPSASALGKKIFNAIRRSSGSNNSDDTLWSPRLNLIFQQQVMIFCSKIKSGLFDVKNQIFKHRSSIACAIYFAGCGSNCFQSRLAVSGGCGTYGRSDLQFELLLEAS